MSQTQLFLDSPTHAVEDPAFLSEQLITYIGNKRALLPFIEKAVLLVEDRLDTEKLSAFDPFVGSGVVARFLKRFSHRLVVNDLEAYTVPIGECYLKDFDQSLRETLLSWHGHISKTLEDERALRTGFITELYAPDRDEAIQHGERAFYTNANARRIDTARQLIAEAPQAIQHYLLGPLLSEASIHANTAGVFKGFYKDRHSGVGKFGGTAANALDRICAPITVPWPVQSHFSAEVEIHRGDANELARHIRDIDLTYIDPPYNQHPYGSNYFMLNLITDYQRPNGISEVSGIPAEWNRSAYNKRQRARRAFWDLVSNLDSKYLLVSYNSEGFISLDEMIDMLTHLGRLEVFEKDYNTFRGCRNLSGRALYVQEFLFLVEVK